MIKEGDVVDFDISPEHSVSGTVREKIDLITDDEGGGYNQYVVEENDGTVWTLHRDNIKGINVPAKPSYDAYDWAMRGI